MYFCTNLYIEINYSTLHCYVFLYIFVHIRTNLYILVFSNTCLYVDINYGRVQAANQVNLQIQCTKQVCNHDDDDDDDDDYG